MEGMELEILKTVLIIANWIVCLAIIVITLMQSKKDEGASGAIMGGGGGSDSMSGSSSFYEKNKGRTKEGRLKKWTVILGVTFAILATSLGIVYMM